MRKTKTISQWVPILLVCFVAVEVASATELGLITGGESGTYYQFGLDLRKLVKPDGINLKVYPSKGSVENIFAVYQRPGIHLGIVQSDVLAFVASLPSNPALTRIARNIRIVFPLYDEQVHIVARHGIAHFDDLAGKRVAVGPEGSGTHLTASLLFKLSELMPSETVLIEPGEALEQLKAGRIDAMIYVAAYPLRLLGDNVTPADGLTLIPIWNKRVLESYDAVEIPANVYDWQTTPVSTAAVKALLVSYDFRGPDCDRVGRFAQQLAKGMDRLTKHGHPRWKSVDLDVPVKGWEQYDCVRKYLGGPSATGSTTGPRPAEPDPLAETLKESLE